MARRRLRLFSRDSGDQLEERVQAATEAAERRATGEILALERDLERARAEAERLRSELERSRAEAEQGPQTSEAAGTEEDRRAVEEAEQRAQRQVAQIRGGADEPIRAEAEAAGRAAEERLAKIEARATAAADRAVEAERGVRREAERLQAHAQRQPAADPGSAKPVQSDAETPGAVSLAEADFDDLRALGMSVTQAKRVLRERERRGGFTDLDQLGDVPGFPRTDLDRIKQRLTL